MTGLVPHVLVVDGDQTFARTLCRLLTLAHAHTRDGRERSEAHLEMRGVIEHAEGLVCLSGCAREGLAVRDPNAVPELARVYRSLWAGARGSSRFFFLSTGSASFR